MNPSGKMDHKDNANLFVVSSNFLAVSLGLQKILDSEALNVYERETLSWVGDLVAEMDWKAEYAPKKVEFCVLATSMAPLFYRNLSLQRIPFDGQYSQRLYHALKSQTMTGFNKEEGQKLQEIFYAMHLNLLGMINRNYCDDD